MPDEPVKKARMQSPAGAERRDVEGEAALKRANRITGSFNRRMGFSRTKGPNHQTSAQRAESEYGQRAMAKYQARKLTK